MDAGSGERRRSGSGILGRCCATRCYATPLGLSALSRCEADGRAPLRGIDVRQSPLGQIRVPPRRHHHQHRAKCGTTWTQMICALLILQEPELPLPSDTLSPWIDMVTRARTDVFADLEAQTHRRFIKTHTPLDGIPSDPVVTYICVGRDPRDVGLSMDRHIGNT